MRQVEERVQRLLESFWLAPVGEVLGALYASGHVPHYGLRAPTDYGMIRAARPSNPRPSNFGIHGGG